MTDQLHKMNHAKELKTLLTDIDLGKPLNMYGRYWLKFCVGVLINGNKEKELMEVLRVWSTGE